MLFDSVTAYLLRFFVYKGRRDNINDQADNERGLAHKVVMRLMRLGSYLRRGYHLFVDIFFIPVCHLSGIWLTNAPI